MITYKHAQRKAEQNKQKEDQEVNRRGGHYCIFDPLCFPWFAVSKKYICTQGRRLTQPVSGGLECWRRQCSIVFIHILTHNTFSSFDILNRNSQIQADIKILAVKTMCGYMILCVSEIAGRFAGRL